MSKGKTREDLTGQKFGMLTVVDFSHVAPGKQSMWNCLCDCGNMTVVSAGHLKSGHTQSCGCYKNKCASERLVTHGDTGTRLYNIWGLMKKRCSTTTGDVYKNYGARGISVCDEWLSDYSNFKEWALSNGYNDNLTIDRIDVNGNYEPSNCRWVDRYIQNRNTRQNRYITFNGQTMILADWAKKIGLSASALAARIDKLGWSIERALTTPNTSTTNT